MITKSAEIMLVLKIGLVLNISIGKMDINEEGDKEFKQMILDFVTEKYVKKDGE